MAYLLARSRIRAEERAEQLQRALGLFLAEPADEQLQSLLGRSPGLVGVAEQQRMQAQACLRGEDLITAARALEGIGNSEILGPEPEPEQGGRRLRHALELYLRIGSPHAERVSETLRFHGL